MLVDRYWDIYVTAKYSFEVIILSLELIISSAIKTYVHTQQRQHISHLSGHSHSHSPQVEVTDVGAHMIRNYSPFSNPSQPLVSPTASSTTSIHSNMYTQSNQYHSSSAGTANIQTNTNTSNEQTPLLAFTSPAIPSGTPFYQMY